MNTTSLTIGEPVAPAFQYIELKKASAAKLGKHANGTIAYRVLCNPEHTSFYLTIYSNSSGGYFSNEYICMDLIYEILNNLDHPAFPSKALKTAFTGKSSNNAGFLAAILHAEGLLARAPVNEAKHILAGDWNDWKAALLTWEGSPAKADVLAAQRADTPMSTEKHNTLMLKRTKATDPAD